jgi:predicted membrane GTPase involved in stress response
MVIGESARTGEMDLNPCRGKKLSNVRTTGAEEKVVLTPPRKMTVEEVIAYMDDDEVHKFMLYVPYMRRCYYINSIYIKRAVF